MEDSSVALPSWMMPNEFKPPRSQGGTDTPEGESIDSESFWGGPALTNKKRHEENAKKLARYVVASFLNDRAKEAVHRAFFTWNFKVTSGLSQIKATEMLGRLERRRNRRRLQLGFIGWKDCLKMEVQAEEVSNLTNRLDGYIKRRLWLQLMTQSQVTRRVALLTWQFHAEQAKSKIQAETLLLHLVFKAGRRFERYKVAKSFSMWRQTLKRNSKLQGLLKVLVHQWLHHELNRAFKSWLFIAAKEEGRENACFTIDKEFEKYKAHRRAKAFLFWKYSFFGSELRKSRKTAEIAQMAVEEGHQKEMLHNQKYEKAHKENLELHDKISELELKVQGLEERHAQYVAEVNRERVGTASLKLSTLYAARKGVSLLWGQAASSSGTTQALGLLFGGKKAELFLRWVLAVKAMRWVEQVKYSHLAGKMTLQLKMVESMQKKIEEAEDKADERIWTSDLLAKKLMREQDARKKYQKEAEILRKKLDEAFVAEANHLEEKAQLKAMLQSDVTNQLSDALTSEGSSNSNQIESLQKSMPAASVNAHSVNGQHSLADLQNLPLAGVDVEQQSLYSYGTSQSLPSRAHSSASVKVRRRPPPVPTGQRRSSAPSLHPEVLDRSRASERSSVQGEEAEMPLNGADAMVHRTLHRVFLRYSRKAMVTHDDTAGLRFMNFHSWISMLSDANLHLEDHIINEALIKVIGKQDDDHGTLRIEECIDMNDFTFALQSISQLVFPGEDEASALRQLLLNHILLLAQGKLADFTEQWPASMSQNSLGSQKSTSPSTNLDLGSDSFVAQIEHEMRAVEEFVTTRDQNLEPRSSVSRSGSSTPTSHYSGQNNWQRPNSTELTMLDPNASYQFSESAGTTGPVFGQVSERPPNNQAPEDQEAPEGFPLDHELFSVLQMPQVQDLFFTYARVLELSFARHAVRRSRPAGRNRITRSKDHSLSQTSEWSSSSGPRERKRSLHHVHNSEELLLEEDGLVRLARDLGLCPDIISSEPVTTGYAIVTRLFPAETSNSLTYQGFLAWLQFLSIGMYTYQSEWTYRTKTHHLLAQLNFDQFGFVLSQPVRVDRDVEEFLWSLFEYYGTGSKPQSFGPSLEGDENEVKEIQMTYLRFQKFAREFGLMKNHDLHSLTTAKIDIILRNVLVQRVQSEKTRGLGSVLTQTPVDLSSRKPPQRLYFLDFCSVLIEISKALNPPQDKFQNDNKERHIQAIVKMLASTDDS